MSKTLGLDIGTNSIGWCIMEDGKSIIDMGVRIFPVGVKDDDYNKSGKEVSKNASRRTARGIRRLYDRYKLRRKLLVKTLRELQMCPSESENTSSKELYELRNLALNQRIDLKEIGRIFLLLNQRRGFRSNKKDAKSEEAKKEKSEMKLKMNKLSKDVEESGCRTVGEYFYRLFLEADKVPNWRNPDEPVERIRNRFVYRTLYEKEFDAIWNKQKEFYTDALTDENKKKIKDNCIFYQRPLKSQKHLVGRCRFEPRKRVAPCSSFDFQEFRIWQQISNLRVNTTDRFRSPLTPEEKVLLANEMNVREKISKADIKRILKLPTSAKFNEMPDKLKGNSTVSKLCNALGKDYFQKLPKNTKYKLWHTLFFANDEEWLENYANTRLELNEEQAMKYTEIDLEPDYSSISVKAIRKIIPFMKEGNDYSKACELAGYHHSYDEEKDSKERELSEKILINKEDDLRSPIVQQAVSETIRLVNSVMNEYGRPDTIRVEFARELKKPKDKREKLKQQNDKKQKRRDHYRKYLKEKLNLDRISKADILKFELWLEMEFSELDLKKLNGKVNAEEFRTFAGDVKDTDKEKYELYLECGRISPYTGKVIGLKELFSSEIEVEHIIPYSKCMDDSFVNKTLCEREFNMEKGNKTSYEYFKDKPDELHAFKERIKYFPDVKQERFLLEAVPDDFLNMQLNNTAYIARQARKKLKTICRNVYVTNGQATGQLRNLWNLNRILNPDGANEKSRLDHRHHAIDALVIANTNMDVIRRLSTASHFDYRGRLRSEHFPLPFDRFVEEAQVIISGILVSYRNKRRLVTTRINKYTHSKSKIGKKQLSNSIRGPLHEETLYGRIVNPETGFENFVTRKPLSWFNDIDQINNIVDPQIRNIIRDHIDMNGGKNAVKKALAVPVFMKSKDGIKETSIKKVRIAYPAKNMIQLRPNENPNLFVL